MPKLKALRILVLPSHLRLPQYNSGQLEPAHMPRLEYLLPRRKPPRSIPKRNKNVQLLRKP